MTAVYRAEKVRPFPIDTSAWDQSPWKEIPAGSIRHSMGKRPDHRPKSEFKIAYTDMALYLMFRVVDRYVRAIAKEDQDEVYKDSCVEFFFSPGPDISQGYFNIEMNCGGTMLFHFQTRPRRNPVVIPAGDCGKILRFHSLPRIVDPEITQPVTWMVAYTIPLAVLEKYCRVAPPRPGAVWRVNCYKCGDGTSHPHWFTWAPVDSPHPDFHRPQSFGRLEFK